MTSQTIPSLVQKKIIPAKRSEVFEAWTNPRIMTRWFLPSLSWTARTEIDLRVGGKWRQDMIDDGSAPHGGHEAEADKCYEHWGEYLEIKPPEKLVFTWNTRQVTDTRVTVELKDLGDSTELTLTHELLPTQKDRDAHAGGWKVCLDNLSAIVSK